jgi:hypothetical protein
MKPGFLDKLVAKLDRVDPKVVQTLVDRLLKEKGFFVEVLRIKTQAEDIRLPVAEFLDARSIGPEAECSSAHLERLAVASFHDRIIRHSLTTVHPSIEAAAEIVGQIVVVPGGKRTKHHVASIRRAVAIGVQQPDNVGNGENDRAIFVGGHRVRHDQSIGIHLVFSGATVGFEIR